MRCAHCDIKKSHAVLNKEAVLKFVDACACSGIKRVGFTGGEPFLVPDLICAISKKALRRGMLFSRIITNGSWFRAKDGPEPELKRLFRARYDGDICLSVDAFHRQDLIKCASLINVAVKIWERPDIISIAAVKGAKEDETKARLVKLACLLHARLIIYRGRPAAIKGNGIFVKISYIALSPVNKANDLKNGWDGRWFKDDFCEGPGNVFFVLPDGTVKPCCGYADTPMLTIGSIKYDGPKELLRNARKNCFIKSIFTSGFHPIRKRLERTGVRFPGKTTNHCFFCHYLTNNIPRPTLERCL